MTQTILHGNRETTIDGAAADGDRLWIPLGDLERTSGWKLEPQGLCQGATCVPIPAGRRSDWVDEKNGRFDLAAFAAHLGEPLVRDSDHGAWSFGPAVRGQETHGSGPVVAPDFELPDLDGKRHSLSAYRGKKVLLFCWSSW